jgi:hypothetical protein
MTVKSHLLSLFGRGPAIQPIAPIRLLTVSITHEEGRGYPLKCYVVMRNESNKAIHVSMMGFLPGRMSLKQETSYVLQVHLREWYPTEHGLHEVAVLPQQDFRAWLGLNEATYGKDAAMGLRGAIGTLVLTVDGRAVHIPI